MTAAIRLSWLPGLAWFAVAAVTAGQPAPAPATDEAGARARARAFEAGRRNACPPA